MLPPPHDTLTVSQPRFKEGDFVKIRRRGEGFWCRILSCAGEALDVRVENDLLRSPELPLGSALRILESDVEQVMTTVDEAEFRELFRTCLRAVPAAPPAERWAAACLAAQVIWAHTH